MKVQSIMSHKVHIEHPVHGDHTIHVDNHGHSHVGHHHEDHKDVAHLKTLIGATISHLEHLKTVHPHAVRELSVAITHAQSASLFADHGVHKGK
jgi:hypothetical protein